MAVTPTDPARASAIAGVSPPPHGASEPGRGRGDRAEESVVGRRSLAVSLRHHRRRAGLTQEELATRAGLSVRTVRGIELGSVGRPRETSLRLLAEVLTVPPHELDRDDGERRTDGPIGPSGSRVGFGSQLPAGLVDFTGRTEIRADLADLLTGSDGVPVVVVHGRPGVGTTALAIQVAHDVREHFPGGQLYAHLGGDQPDAAEVLGRFLRTLGVDGGALPPTVEERSAAFRARVSDGGILMVLDDATTEAQVRPLLPGTAGNAVVVTSRGPLAGLLSARPLVLAEMDSEQSIALLSQLVGPHRVAADPDAARRIVRACTGSPLALRIAGARARDIPLGELADVLSDDSRRLEELTAGDTTLRGSLAAGYRRLDPAAQRAYRALGRLPAPGTPLSTLAALLDVDETAARVVAGGLVTSGLLDVSGRGAATRYRMPELVRLHARELAAEERPGGASPVIRVSPKGFR